MAGSLRDELDAFMKARVEQLPEWHEAMDAPGDMVSLEALIKVTARINGIQREAILKLAEEVDRLRSSG